MKFARLQPGEKFETLTPEGRRIAQVGRVSGDGETGHLIWADDGSPLGSYTRGELIAAGFRPAQQ